MKDKKNIFKKKSWKQPQLIVLKRGRAEENVILGCKAMTTGNTGYGGVARGCRKSGGSTGPMNCFQMLCSSVTSS